MFARSVLLISLALCAAACAGSGKRGPGQGQRPSASIQQPSSLLAKARTVQGRQGCAKAAPTYRIVASYGEGYEIAQYELGACLMEMEGAGAQETVLFREEGLFWLKRAAWAGDPRAQLKLTQVLSGVPAYAVSHVAVDPLSAMTWAEIYDANGVRETYGLQPVGPVVLEKLHAALDQNELQRARKEAAGFTKISLDEFVPPVGDRAGQGGQRPQSGQAGGGRPEGRRRR
ncbi:hypothetical protein PUV54_05295 [Hyphococcus flavus]|uniref:Lipoprotein n=1 Tax=Hyphococcus flavus TaxID=1866326 RepID=A0AAF0CGN1_9PROT|nr:hypothetical protein [Hyphococcus flavus]WDI32609.1 hypothetical protein PUV54_05295 [Hyphococcus flavus]